MDIFSIFQIIIPIIIKIAIKTNSKNKICLITRFNSDFTFDSVTSKTRILMTLQLAKVQNVWRNDISVGLTT